MLINKYHWQFDVDIVKTRLMYSSRPKTFLDAQRQIPELVEFLSDLGINIEKPDEYQKDYSDVIYTMIGSAKSETGYEIDLYGEDQYLSIVIYNKKDTVVLEVFGMIGVLR